MYSYLTEELHVKMKNKTWAHSGAVFLVLLQEEKMYNNRKTQLKIARAHVFRMISLGSTPWAEPKTEWPAEWGRWFCSALAPCATWRTTMSSSGYHFLCFPQQKKDMGLLEQVQSSHRNDQRAGAPLLQRQAKFGLLSLKKRRLWGDLLVAFQYLKRAHKKRESNSVHGQRATGQRRTAFN